MTPGRVLRAVGTLVLAAVALLAVLGLAPFALREQATDGPVADTAAELTGQAQAATTGLRGLGHSCSDAILGSATVTRSCSHVRGVSTSKVQFVADTGTGDLQVVRVAVDQGRRSATEAHGDVLGVIGRAVDLSPADQAQVVAAASADDDEVVLQVGWGTAVVRTGIGGGATGSTFGAAGGPGPGLRPSPATLALPVDALARAAVAHGYTCTTPQVQTIRSCGRTVDGYHDDLWLQGSSACTTSVYLSVTSTYRTRTRSRWVSTMDQALAWVDTAQTRALRSWLAGSSDAPGASVYVQGLPFSFTVRDDEYVKETFGGLAAEGASTVDDMPACGP